MPLVGIDNPRSPGRCRDGCVPSFPVQIDRGVGGLHAEQDQLPLRPVARVELVEHPRRVFDLLTLKMLIYSDVRVYSLEWSI
jgi:hypothetical protein